VSRLCPSPTSTRSSRERSVGICRVTALCSCHGDRIISAEDFDALIAAARRLVAVEAERDTLREALERIARPDTWTMQRDRHGQIAWAALNGVSPDGPACRRCGATDAAQQCPKGMHHQFVLPPSVVPGEREREDKT
jgi:hypothetical protein